MDRKVGVYISNIMCREVGVSIAKIMGRGRRLYR